MERPRGYRSLDKCQKRQWSTWSIVGGCGTVAAILLAAAVCTMKGAAPATLLRQWLDSTSQQHSLDSTKLCDQLQDSAKQLCQGYSNAAGEDRWTAAAQWRRAHLASCKCCSTPLTHKHFTQQQVLHSSRHAYSSVPSIFSRFLVACTIQTLALTMNQIHEFTSSLRVGISGIQPAAYSGCTLRKGTC